MSSDLEEQGLVAAQLAGLRRHGLPMTAALRLVLPSLSGPLKQEGQSLVAALDQGTLPQGVKSHLFESLSRAPETDPDTLEELAQGLATAAEAELAWIQTSRPWTWGGAGLLLLLCGAGWTYRALPGQGADAVGVVATFWWGLDLMRWLGVPLAALWFIYGRAAWLPLRAEVTRPFLLAASLRGLGTGAMAPMDRSRAGSAEPKSDSLWKPEERRVYLLLRARHGDAITNRAFAAELEKEGRFAASKVTSISTLLVLAGGLFVLATLAAALALPIFTLAGRA